jgi:hypothetical protein
MITCLVSFAATARPGDADCANAAEEPVIRTNEIIVAFKRTFEPPIVPALPPIAGK